MREQLGIGEAVREPLNTPAAPDGPTAKQYLALAETLDSANERIAELERHVCQPSPELLAQSEALEKALATNEKLAKANGHYKARTAEAEDQAQEYLAEVRWYEKRYGPRLGKPKY